MRIKNHKGNYINLSLQPIYEALIKDAEFSISFESNPILTDFKERMENDDFEDISVLFVENLQNFELFRDTYFDNFNLKRNRTFLDLYLGT